MVFHSASKTETPPAPPAPMVGTNPTPNNNANTSPMTASSVVKTHPLHNFSFPNLKWSLDNSNTHSFRKLVEQSPEIEKGHAVSEKQEKKRGAEADASDPAADNSKKSTAGGGSKTLVRRGTKRSKSDDDGDDDDDDDSWDQTLNDMAEEVIGDLVPKTWNLRPRKPVSKALIADGDSESEDTVQGVKAQGPSGSRKDEHGKTAAEKKKNYSISLTKEEIEEDIFLMTGSKPSRRPSKRAKNVQKQIDNIYPGMWLTSATLDSYKG